MIFKENLKININKTPLVKNFPNLFKEYKNLLFFDNKKKEKIINFWFIDSLTSNKIFESISSDEFNVFLYFCQDEIISERLIKLFSYGTVYLLSLYWQKAEIEKKIKEIFNELSESFYFLQSSNYLIRNYEDSALFLYLERLSKKIINSEGAFFILDTDNPHYGLGFLLYLILKNKYLPQLEYSDVLESYPNSPACKKFIHCDSGNFLKYIQSYQPSDFYIYYVKNIKPEEYQKNSEVCKRSILLPPLSEFKNCSEAIIDFLSSYLIKDTIILSNKAFSVLIKNIYNFNFSDFESLLRKISSSKIRILTENMLMIFLEGGEKKLINDLSFYLKQILHYNCINWKIGNVYDKTNSLLKQMLIRNALEICNGHKKNAAKILGINRNRLTNNKGLPLDDSR